MIDVRALRQYIHVIRLLYLAKFLYLDFMPVDPINIARLENQPDKLRNVCILAHIDHGKTSLSDCLLASNGIISQQHQGEIRYLDSRQDEQERGITMEASAISLYFRTPSSEFLVNLIDSPGHVDFSSEVTHASRLCDAAIILVDALEGVGSQTVSALKQAWDEELQSILVINKIDKLYDDWQLTSQDAATHLHKLVEQVNAVWGQFYVGKRMETEKDDDEVVYFSPTNNNVVFCSALQGWGFTIQHFAAIYEKKIGVDKTKLAKFLWGDYSLDPKTKKVVSGVATKRKSMFTQFVMDNIWAVYDAVAEEDTWKIDKIVQALNLKPVNDLNVKSIFHQWIPVSRAVLSGIVSLPAPPTAQNKRLDCVLRNTPSPELIDSRLKDAMSTADINGPPLAYVSKVISVPDSDIPTGSPIDANAVPGTSSSGARMMADRLAALRLQSERLTKSESDTKVVVLGFSRIYSGVFKPGMELDLLGPRHDPAEPEKFRTKVKISGVYISMGRDLVSVSQAGPGAIVGFSGLDDHIVKSGTLVQSGMIGPNMARSAHVAAPILRVAVEPKDPRELDAVENGLRLLNIADPSVEFEISSLGEFILATSGELHLERCLNDMVNRYAKVELDVSPPVVPFRETICAPFSGEKPITIDVSGSHLSLKVRPATEQDQENSENSILKIRNNCLIDGTPERVLMNKKFGTQSVISGFSAAMARGPLIEEPVHGVSVVIKELTSPNDDTNAIAQRRLISATKRAIYEAMQEWGQRIMLAMYLCEIQASTEALGRAYGVITRRKGKVLTEELKEGTPFLLIRAELPVIESIGFSEEIRKKTSGAANPQLTFSHFETLEEDPFWVPTTEEELEELGEIADRENIALNYVKQIRRRKGLKVGDKLVENAESDRSHRH